MPQVACGRCMGLSVEQICPQITGPDSSCLLKNWFLHKKKDGAQHELRDRYSQSKYSGLNAHRPTRSPGGWWPVQAQEDTVRREIGRVGSCCSRGHAPSPRTHPIQVFLEREGAEYSCSIS